MTKQNSYTKAICLGAIDSTQVRRPRNSYNSKIPRIDFDAACKEAYVELDSWANSIRSNEFDGRKVIITTELQHEDPSAPLVVPGLYLVCTVRITGSQS